MSVSLESGRIRSAVDGADLAIDAMPSGAPICREASQRVLVRVKDRVSEPIHLTVIENVDPDVDLDGPGARLQFSDELGQYRARLTIKPGERGLAFDLVAEGPEPIWMFEWTVDGLDLDEVVIPALGGQVIQNSMPPGESIAFKYPFWWNAQFVIGMASAFDGGVWLRTTDEEPRFKMLRISRNEKRQFALTLGIEQDAPLSSTPVHGSWYIDTFNGSWMTPAEMQREWMTRTFGLVPYRSHPHWPGWTDDIALVFELWGMNKNSGRPAHTFSQMEQRLQALADRFPPRNTLLYLPGYAQGGIDSNIPEYGPSEKLGGKTGFKRLVDRAHSMGFRVMIHTNVLGMAYSHPRYPEFAKYQVIDVFDRPQGWAMDLDGDWLTEPYFAYMNPGETAWTELMAGVLGGLIEEFRLDGVFLDQTLLAFNVSSGPNFVTGMRSHIERLQDSFPNVIFAGEGLNDLVQSALPMAQIHGIDSISGVHGLDSTRQWRKVHPVSAFVFGESTRFTAHLLTKHPSHPMFANQENAYRELGVLPALVSYDSSQDFDHPAVAAVLERARSEITDRTKA